MNQRLETIRQLLTSNTTVTIFSAPLAELRFFDACFDTVKLKGYWDGRQEQSRIVYGLSRKAACSWLAMVGESSVIHRQKGYSCWHLLRCYDEGVEDTFTSVDLLPDDTTEQTYSEFDGIKFKLV